MPTRSCPAARRSPIRPRARAGYTLAELLTVVVVLGILANIALPMYKRAKLEADATRVIGDFNVVRHAALHHFSQAGTFPANSGWRRVPAELVDDLPANFGFAYTEVEYRWRRWATPGGLQRRSRDPGLVGLEIRSPNRALLAEIRDRFGGTTFGIGNRLTLIIE